MEARVVMVIPIRRTNAANRDTVRRSSKADRRHVSRSILYDPSGTQVKPYAPKLKEQSSSCTQLRFALSRPKTLSNEPGTGVNATFARFHALIAITSNVRSESSFSENWARTLW